jgi:nitric oxide reductase NorD protein
MICEGAAIDRLLSLELPGLVREIENARHEALTARPRYTALTPREQEVERILLDVLAAPPSRLPEALPFAATPAASFLWACEQAAALESVSGRYRGLPPVPLWGRLESQATDAVPVANTLDARDQATPVPSDRVRALRRRPRVRPSPDDEDDGAMGMSMIQLDEPQEHVEDPMGLQRPADRDQDKDADDLADSLSELPEARLVTAPGSPAEALVSDDPPARRAVQPEGVPRRAGIAYPEWDHRIGAYHMGRAVVREHPVPPGEPRWVEGVLRRHKREVEAVRRRFERLRPQRVRLNRQVDGADVDTAAYTMAYADARAGHGGEDRLYEAVRPVRRDFAVTLLVDISASTDSWLSAERRIIDVEKEAVLLVCEGLDALGDRYSVSAFSGEGPDSVAYYPIKEFGERYGSEVRRRIAGLEHDRFTRMGAAIRHATTSLARERAYHRLLLLLTDGKPNDLDLYEGRYGIEDTRQSVAEARLQGLHPFCLTVDREAPAYLPRLFGPGSYAVLRRAHTLPQALIEVVRRLLHG